MRDYKKTIERFDVEHSEKWRDIVDKIPYIKFKEDWEVRIIPPFGGAVARFNVKKNDALVSIYLDWYDVLGCVGQPYWEVYPVNGDCERCLLNETNDLIKIVEKSIKQQLTNSHN